MNNTIEVLQEIRKYYAQDIIRGTETGSKRFKAIEKAISNEKVLEIAGDMLPSYESGGRADEDIPDDKEHAYSLGYGDGQIDYKHKAEPVLAKQILKVKELENSMLTKSEFKNILSEFSPSVASDSGQPEWSSRELDKVWDFITGRAKYICSSDDDLRKIKELEAKIKEIENEN